MKADFPCLQKPVPVCRQIRHSSLILDIVVLQVTFLSDSKVFQREQKNILSFYFLNFLCNYWTFCKTNVGWQRICTFSKVYLVHIQLYILKKLHLKNLICFCSLQYIFVPWFISSTLIWHSLCLSVLKHCILQGHFLLRLRKFSRQYPLLKVCLCDHLHHGNKKQALVCFHWFVILNNIVRSQVC